MRAVGILGAAWAPFRLGSRDAGLRGGKGDETWLLGAADRGAAEERRVLLLSNIAYSGSQWALLSKTGESQRWNTVSKASWGKSRNNQREDIAFPSLLTSLP